MIAPFFARAHHGRRKEVESNVTTLSDSLDSSSLKHKLTYLEMKEECYRSNGRNCHCLGLYIRTMDRVLFSLPIVLALFVYLLVVPETWLISDSIL